MATTKPKTKKSDENEVVTKGFFRSELKKELKSELALYATKNDLYDLENRINLKFDKLNDNIMQFKDDIVSMYLKIKTETVSLKALYDENDERIENHEMRITSLETKKI